MPDHASRTAQPSVMPSQDGSANRSQHAQEPARPARLSRKARAARHQDTRAALVRCGTEMCTRKGFRATGIEEILKQVGVPKGSFYHFFSSKQEFGEAVIDNYAAYFARKLDRFLGNDSLPPLDRLKAFTEDAQQGMIRYRFERGCLVGNLGQELGELNHAFRQRLEAVLLSWQRRTAACLAEAAARGDIPADADVDALAEFFWIGWEGAILRAKLAGDVAPMQRFTEIFFAKALA